MLIIIPDNFVAERKYILNVLISEFLGLEASITQEKSSNYVFKLENGNELVIEDHFFNQFKENEGYLQVEAIPKEVTYVKGPFMPESDLPVIYGCDRLTVEQDNIRCGIDIFASSFFMLTRWEEYVNQVRDKHQRFPASESLAFKCGFLERPVVNEYVEFLWSMLVRVGVDQQRKVRSFSFVPTHDVDHIQYYQGVKKLSRAICGDLISRKDLSLAVQRIPHYLRVKRCLEKDPFDTFDDIMTLSEQMNVASRFYFMSGGITKYDNDYSIHDPRCLSLIEEIKNRGHTIGFHPSYNSYNDAEQWGLEKKRLEEVLHDEVVEGRQHYLRFASPLTWRIWNDYGMKVDSTAGYADQEGFRCGVCYTFRVFDVVERKPLSIHERPLIVMEATLLHYQKVTPEQMLSRTLHLLEKVKKYNGEFVYLWHNSSFNTKEWAEYHDVYQEVVLSS